MHPRLRRALCAGALAALLATPAGAGTVEATIVDDKGKPVEDAILIAYPAKSVGAGKPVVVDVDQVNKEFVPRVSAVAVGTPIRFPNHDQIRHHVYSFSPAKTFEIPLYKGVPAEAIVFDKPGVVTLGCNIHDWMQGWVLVTEAALHGTSDASGRVTLSDVPAGPARLQVWHPNLKGSAESTEQSVTVEASGSASARFEIRRKKVWKARRGGRSRDRYN